jgi:hypothetical protein
MHMALLDLQGMEPTTGATGSDSELSVVLCYGPKSDLSLLLC